MDIISNNECYAARGGHFATSGLQQASQQSLHMPPIMQHQSAANGSFSQGPRPGAGTGKKSKRPRRVQNSNGWNVQLNNQICQIAGKGDVWALLELAQKTCSEMNDVNLSTFLQRVARCAKQAKLVQAVNSHPQIARVRARVEAGISAWETALAEQRLVAQPRQWSSIVWSYATLQIDDRPTFLRIAKLSLSSLEVFKPMELSNLLWAFAKARISTPALFEAAMQHLPAQLDLLTPVSLSSVAWAYATMHPQLAVGLLKGISAAFVERVDQVQSQEIANMCWALATAKVVKTSIFNRLGSAALQKIHSFNVQEIANTLWAFSRAGVKHVELFEGVGNLLSQNSRLVSSFREQGQGLANTMWALAKQFQMGGNSIFQNIAISLMLACYQALERFKSQELTSVLWSVAMLGFKLGCNTLVDKLFPAAADLALPRLYGLSAQGMTNVLYAFTQYTNGSHCHATFLGQLLTSMLDRLDEFNTKGLTYAVESAHELISKKVPVPGIHAFYLSVACELLKLQKDLPTTTVSRVVSPNGVSPEQLDISREAIAEPFVPQHGQGAQAFEVPSRGTVQGEHFRNQNQVRQVPSRNVVQGGHCQDQASGHVFYMPAPEAPLQRGEQHYREAEFYDQSNHSSFNMEQYQACILPQPAMQTHLQAQRRARVDTFKAPLPRRQNCQQNEQTHFQSQPASAAAASSRWTPEAVQQALLVLGATQQQAFEFAEPQRQRGHQKQQWRGQHPASANGQSNGYPQAPRPCRQNCQQNEQTQFQSQVASAAAASNRWTPEVVQQALLVLGVTQQQASTDPVKIPAPQPKKSAKQAEAQPTVVQREMAPMPIGRVTPDSGKGAASMWSHPSGREPREQEHHAALGRILTPDYWDDAQFNNALSVIQAEQQASDSEDDMSETVEKRAATMPELTFIVQKTSAEIMKEWEAEKKDDEMQRLTRDRTTFDESDLPMSVDTRPEDFSDMDGLVGECISVGRIRTPNMSEEPADSLSARDQPADWNQRKLNLRPSPMRVHLSAPNMPSSVSQFIENPVKGSAAARLFVDCDEEGASSGRPSQDYAYTTSSSPRQGRLSWADEFEDETEFQMKPLFTLESAFGNEVPQIGR